MSGSSRVGSCFAPQGTATPHTGPTVARVHDFSSCHVDKAQTLTPGSTLSHGLPQVFEIGAEPWTFGALGRPPTVSSEDGGRWDSELLWSARDSHLPPWSWSEHLSGVDWKVHL
jgi:hypothetical protein